jgi:sigma-54 dependent transcriptional regulator, acetoin dehydrogenase operon transcriptional activator AcoR
VLVSALLRRHGAHPSTRCRPDVVDALSRYGWPGNVRQLDNVVAALVARRPAGDVAVEDLPTELQCAVGPDPTGLQQMERDAILVTLAATSGNRAEAATRLGISRSTLYRKLHAYGLEPGAG